MGETIELKKPQEHVYIAINKVIEHFSKQGLKKNKTNDHFKFKFRGIDDLMQALSPILVKEKINILPKYTSRKEVQGEKAVKVVIEGGLQIVSIVDGSHYTVYGFNEAIDRGDKATSKAMSLFYKYLLIQTFCIPVEGLEDGDKESNSFEKKNTSEYITTEQAQEVVKIVRDLYKDPKVFLKQYNIEKTSKIRKDEFLKIKVEIERAYAIKHNLKDDNEDIWTEEAKENARILAETGYPNENN